jgi:hypothetical protein
MSDVYVRNLETGAIKTVDSASEEFGKLKAERTDDNRFPVWEQTSAGDADPENHSSDYEIRHRAQWDAPLHDVTTDGVRISGDGQLGRGDIEYATRTGDASPDIPGEEPSGSRSRSSAKK